MDIPELPKVFFIRGVFKHTARSIQEVIETRAPIVDDLEPLIKLYEDWNDKLWLEQRAIRCTTCPRLVGRCSNDEHPVRQIFIPEALEKNKKGAVWKPHDTTRFCSWPCAQYHIVYHLKNDNRFILLLKHLYTKWMGKQTDEIAASEHPWRCIELGGDRSLEDLHRINDFNMARLQSSFEQESDDDLE